MFSLSVRISRGFTRWRDHCFKSQPASREERTPRPQPVPSGQKGSRRESPTTASSSWWPRLTRTAHALRAE